MLPSTSPNVNVFWTFVVGSVKYAAATISGIAHFIKCELIAPSENNFFITGKINLFADVSGLAVTIVLVLGSKEGL